ncbi:MAG: selenocysteine-specific translation elongation factor [Oscillospiraceae bacterium]|jgi:selenocysteine-specific elongation factor|nr:selenocysteine-specific translation elongation factor [Oscillospiraceae bacterium]
MKRIILGTAGHIDHGKTSLVRYITGVNTDRLKEEISRGITIELGFAPFVLPDGQRIGIVDVPGHERFIKNMLAGATGIDVVLFVIAADEGVMPQTREHMDILRILGVNRGVVALTKIDAVDADWLELVREDVAEYLKDSPLRDAKIVEVSSVTGQGIPALLDVIAELCAETPERVSAGVCRLAVDRVFTMSGFGTVVTGTLWSGAIRQGDTLELLPSRKQARVRSLQVHGEKRDEVYAGERVAANLAGVEKAFAERGSWLAAPDSLKDSTRISLRLELLPDAPEIAHRTRVHVHHGTTEVLARIVLLDRSALAPGESCFAQLELETPLAALPGDRVVLRFYSPMFTIGGGTVVDASAAKFKRRNLESELTRLAALYGGEPTQVLRVSMAKDGRPWSMAEISECLSRTDEKEPERIVREMVDSGVLIELQDGLLFLAETANGLKEKLTVWLNDYFARFPMRFAVPKKEVAQEHLSKMDPKQQRAVFRYLDGAGGFEQDETAIWPDGWKPVITAQQSAVIADIRELFAQTPYSPPPWSDAVAALNIADREQGEYLQWFLRSGEMVRLSDNVVYTRDAMQNAEKTLCAQAPDGFTLAEARDILETPRKYAQQIAEYFDLMKITRWDGERRFWLRRG